ncbi:hypothetical protein ACOSP7_014991 [Xanthoceras sorbifolium]
MMSFCRKSVHSFLGLTNLNCNNYSPTATTAAPPGSPCRHGLGLITDDNGGSPTHVIESSALKLLPPPSPAVKGGGVFLPKKDPGGIGFIDEVGGGVDGLMSCTESLGFESSDERTVDDLIDQLGNTRVESLTSTTTSSREKWRKVGERRREMKKFPPPLSSFNHHGQPSFFLRPVRKDGRLELTEVRIDRPEILRAYREDGRLRLHLIRDDDDEFIKEEEQNYNQEIQQQQQNNQDQEEEKEEEEEIEEKLMEEENIHEEETVGEWKFPVTGEGFRRCNEPMVAHDCHDYHHHRRHHHNMSHHHNLHVWGQHYVTTR